MASKYTDKFQLCQWAATDPVLRSDFNADNKKIDAALKTIPRIMSGSYTGNGTYGADNPRSLSFPFTPMMVVITTDAGSDLPSGSVFIQGQTMSDGIGNHSNPAYGLVIHLTWSSGKVSWYSTQDAEKQLNAEGQNYRYFVIGV